MSEKKAKYTVSSRGVAFSQDAAQDKDWIKIRSPFVCSLCEYPVLATWMFCPSCGGMLEWTSLVEPAGGNE